MARRKEIPAALWKRIEPLIPPVKPSPKGGRPRVSDQQALNGIVYVLRTGIPWEELPQELGYGSGMTCWRRLRDWQAAGVVIPPFLAFARSRNAMRPWRAAVLG